MRINAAAWFNAMLVVVTYQFFVFAVIIAVIFLTFLALASEAVSVDVAGEWIFGDGEYGEPQAMELLSRNVLDSPWLRVPLFLTLFSSLYFATHSLASKESRIEYFQGLDSAIKIRFAIRLGYRLAQSEEEHRGPAPAATSSDVVYGSPAGERRGAVM
jgi:hypothetical protein